MLAKNHDDVGDCTICEAGKFNDDDGDVTNDFSKHGPDSCQVCGQGKYNDDDGDVAANHAGCTSCPAGRYNEYGGTQALQNNGVDDCELCISGRYAAEVGAANCDVCPSGLSSAPGASVCGSCPAGYFCPEEGVAQPCAEGQYTDGTHDSCQSCTAGYRCPGGMNRQMCTPGSFQGATGKGTCEECQAGKFQNSPGKEVCTNCPFGHFCPKSSATPIKCGSVGLYCKEGEHKERKDEALRI